MSIKEISPVEGSTAYAPFLVVLLISLIREAIEDYKKAKYDTAYNNSTSNVFDFNIKQFKEETWKNITLGQIIKVEKDAEIPADLLIIKSSNENGFCYLKTSNLDGETNLKPREAINFYHNSINKESDLNILGSIEIDKPNKNIYSIEGCITKENSDKIYFNESNCLLRGGVLKKVKYIYGIVIYTGKETKMMMNIKKGAQKKSSLDILLNKIVIIFIVIAVFSAILLGSIGIQKTNDNTPNVDKGKLKMDYVYYRSSSNHKVLEGVRTIVGFLNIFGALIPISIMISLEVVKTLQTVILSMEEGYAVNDEKKKFLSLKLHENLGSIKYIFSDKTGTLTKNEMEFKGCSIFTKLYCQSESATTMYETNAESSTRQKSIFSKDFNPIILKDSLSNDEEIQINATRDECPFSTLSEVTLEFFLNIAINHNVLVNVEEAATNVNSSYSGSNPDEVVLVQAAKELGIEFVERIGEDYKIKVNGTVINFTMLNRFDFTSERKRSSIIIRDSLGQIKMYMKGADSVILKKINAFSQQKLYAKTNEHVDKFAKEGLRTLCYSMKFLTAEEYKEFNAKYSQLQEQYLSDKSKIKEIEELISTLENNMILLGVTALEDMLQDNVKASIKDFIDANINVWMLTGDKLDTAESIGYSCRLLTEDTEVFKIKEKDKENIKIILEEIRKEIYKNKGEKLTILQENKDEQIELPEINNNNIDNNEYDGLAAVPLKPIQRRSKSRSRSITIQNKLILQSHLMDKAYEKNNIIHLPQPPQPHIIIPVGPKISTSNIEPINTLEDKPIVIEKQKEQCIQVFPQNTDNNYTISNNVIESSITHQEKQAPNDNSILKYMVNKNFFNDESLKDSSLSFMKTIRKQKKSELDINKMKENFKNELRHFEIESETDESNRNIQFNNFAIIIEGDALEVCLRKSNADTFYDCLSKCRSVICSRCAPIQKSQVVDFIKTHSHQMTLAIGDGGNDVNMIQSADIGIGIFGKEGSQAAYSSDFAFSQFHYVRRLLFYHGRYSAMRNAYFVNFYFYKNILYCFIQFFFSLHAFFSGSIYYDNFYMLGFNSFLTTLQPCIYSLFEEDIDITFNSSKKREMGKMLIPDLYREMRDKNPFSIYRFVFTILSGIIMAIVCFYLPYLSYRLHPMNQTGRMGSLCDYSACSFWALVLSSYVVLIVDSYCFNSWSSSLHGLQVCVLIAFPIVQNTFDNFLIGGKFYDIIGTGMFWLTLLACVYVNFVMFYICRTVERFFTNNLVTRIRLNEISNDIQRKMCLKKLIEAQKYERCLNKFKKVYNMKEGDEPENFIDKKMKDYVDKFKMTRNDDLLLIRKVNEHAKRKSYKQMQIRKKSNV